MLWNFFSLVLECPFWLFSIPKSNLERKPLACFHTIWLLQIFFIHLSKITSMCSIQKRIFIHSKGLQILDKITIFNYMFALVDCNNFYVSCERVFQPRLENSPLLFYQITMDVSSLEVMKQKRLVYRWGRLPLST